MDVLLPADPSGPVPVVVWIHGGAFLFGSRLHGPVTEPARRALIERGVAVALVEYLWVPRIRDSSGHRSRIACSTDRRIRGDPAGRDAIWYSRARV
jgi:BD-FAE